ncbi:MAG: SBBP repeat-containing protein [Acidobacteriota bacterium]
MRFGRVTLPLLPIAVSYSLALGAAAGAAQRGNAVNNFGPGQLPLGFEANQGQFDPEVLFATRGRGYTLYLTDSAAVLLLSRAVERQAPHSPTTVLLRRPLRHPEAGEVQHAVVRMKLTGSARKPATGGLEKLPGITNYFLGNDPSRWRTRVPNYARVRLEGVYSGVDVEYYGHEGRLEYDFIVRPGADPKAIQVAFEGADRMRVDEHGDLVLETPLGEVRWRKPMVYQERDGARRPVEAAYVLKGHRQVAFDVGRYDRRRPLVIDPVLVYSTYLGGSGREYGFGLATDAAGNLYLSGATGSSDFPNRNAMQPRFGGSYADAFVGKLNPAGSAWLYLTFVGGTGDDYAHAIAVDSVGNAHITGCTESPNFPTVSALQATHGGRQDSYITKLNPDGSRLLYSSYVGGKDQDDGYGLAVDRLGRLYLAGETSSADFPIQAAFQPKYGGLGDGFVMKLDTSGPALVYSTFLGGPGIDDAHAIAVDATGSVTVAGKTGLNDGFPTVNPLQPKLAGGSDAFVAKLDPTGASLLYSTFLGGSGYDDCLGMAQDASGNIYLAGNTRSQNFPTVNPLSPKLAGISDAFVAKLNPAGTALLYSTYLGGSGEEELDALAIDSAGNAHLAGATLSEDFPSVDALQPKCAANVDVFVTKLNAAGSAVLYSTCLGGAGQDYPKGITVSGSGDVYVTGQSYSVNFPLVNPLQPNYAGGPTDAWVAKIAPSSSPQFTVAGVLNAASYAGGAVAAGEIITIFGTDIGPPELATMQLTADGQYATKVLANTRVLFDDVAAPLLYVLVTQLSVVVPLAVAGKASTQVQIQYMDRLSPLISVPVARAAPGIFTIPPTGKGQGAILHWPDYRVNSRANPAAKNGVIMVYATSGGLAPPAEDGKVVTEAQPLPLPVTATIGGVAATVSYAGGAPGLLTGVLQVNIVVPDNAPSGDAVPLVITVGGVRSQDGVTVAIR